MGLIRRLPSPRMRGDSTRLRETTLTVGGMARRLELGTQKRAAVKRHRGTRGPRERGLGQGRGRLAGGCRPARKRRSRQCMLARPTQARRPSVPRRRPVGQLGTARAIERDETDGVGSSRTMRFRSKVHDFRELCRTYNPQPLRRTAKTPERPMLPEAKCMPTSFSLRPTLTPLRGVELGKCRQTAVAPAGGSATPEKAWNGCAKPTAGGTRPHAPARPAG